MRRGAIRLLGIGMVVGGFVLTRSPLWFGRNLAFVSSLLAIFVIGIGVWLNVVPITPRSKKTHNKTL